MEDEEGSDLAKSLEYNTSLERLSLEGNLLGSRFLEALAKTLMVNTTLKAIDLEGNCLTKGSENGIHALCEVFSFEQDSKRKRYSEVSKPKQHRINSDVRSLYLEHAETQQEDNPVGH